MLLDRALADPDMLSALEPPELNLLIRHAAEIGRDTPAVQPMLHRAAGQVDLASPVTHRCPTDYLMETISVWLAGERPNAARTFAAAAFARPSLFTGQLFTENEQDRMLTLLTLPHWPGS